VYCNDDKTADKCNADGAGVIVTARARANGRVFTLLETCLKEGPNRCNGVTAPDAAPNPNLQYCRDDKGDPWEIGTGCS